MINTSDATDATVALRQRRRLDEAGRHRQLRLLRRNASSRDVSDGSRANPPVPSTPRPWGDVLLGRVDLRVIRGG
jgi:hypothetical protein